jgi:hypothetical protein
LQKIKKRGGKEFGNGKGGEDHTTIEKHKRGLNFSQGPMSKQKENKPGQKRFCSLL